MGTATQLLHRLTSYAPDRERDFVSNDIARLPWYFKRYPGSPPRLSLPRDLPETSASAVEILAGTEVDRGDLDLRVLSRLLYLSAGLVRTAERPYGTVPFRAAGSAGEPGVVLGRSRGTRGRVPAVSGLSAGSLGGS